MKLMKLTKLTKLANLTKLTKNKFIHNSIPFNKYQNIHFKKSFNNLSKDKYHVENKNMEYPTRLRKYCNYDVHIDHPENKIEIIHNTNTSFEQNVKDDRKNIRNFDIIDDYYNPMLLQIMKLSISHTYSFQKIEKLNVSVHQVRQMVYPNISSHNSPEGIHRDGADYIISAFVVDRYNVKDGISKIYDHDKNEIYQTILNENEYIFQNDTDLYHYITPIKYCNENNLDNYGYRDIIGIDIQIL